MPVTAEPRVVTVAEFSAYLGRTDLAGSAMPDALAKQHLLAAEELVESRISYELASTTETRSLWVGGESVLRLPGGLREITSIKHGDTDVERYRTLAISKRPAHLLLLPRQYADELTIEGDWGFEECPAPLVNAICAIAARDHFVRMNRQADIAQTVDGAATSYFDRIPTAASQAIAEFRVPGF